MMKTLSNFIKFVLGCLLLLPIILGYVLVFIMMGPTILVGAYRQHKKTGLWIKTWNEPSQRETMYLQSLVDDIIVAGTQLIWGAILTVGIVQLVTQYGMDMTWEESKPWNILFIPGTIVIWFLGEKLARLLGIPIYT